MSKDEAEDSETTDTSDPREPRHQHEWSYNQPGKRTCEWCRYAEAAPTPVRR